MINYIWFIIIAFGIIFGLVTGRGEIVSKAIVNSTASTVELTIELLGLMCLWCGIMRIAQKSGLTDKLAKILKPILRIIFKDSFKNDKIMTPMIMNLTSNMMGLSNAATPFGIETMNEMEKVNPVKGTATNDMAKFLVLNAACIQFIPTSVISIRAACGSQNPGIIIIPAIITTGIAAFMGIAYCKILERYF
ncbi:spore maturation protein A [Clostridium pasteurianum DSM 525 = ATCC 6013]|uniref:Nucleoside recognition domain protein n=1 Tax=Clostridium pasteurianum DSM 525 = ATCC 6013 TaxID=1262449 RepID=A0A0H3IXR6_CLOPA|nr:nucleoside recognition domain-containing protein [Clostridium pasteurianum]AJA46261.1 spore maturation protein A [Clostridium pasteurianum DSM 525 = ATCC 6013]AJA50249.1 spore maturation protein A [Clostridium pasteurianum DSM 525 = ATCC 6013]AOZ73714.1 spore maturation protein [Clostridium pasteurianum DSM 525 = ATCC 6013]AOZ77511.1 spore maturation protein [Clostridium pasteurianum]ELP60845.1 spore maturation protein A [Clostridium pasteurianum DSM 525 = ATCC 6013]